EVGMPSLDTLMVKIQNVSPLPLGENRSISSPSYVSFLRNDPVWVSAFSSRVVSCFDGGPRMASRSTWSSQSPTEMTASPIFREKIDGSPPASRPPEAGSSAAASADVCASGDGSPDWPDAASGVPTPVWSADWPDDGPVPVAGPLSAGSAGCGDSAAPPAGWPAPCGSPAVHPAVPAISKTVFVSLHLEKCASAASWRPRKDGRLDRRPPFSFDVLERLLDDFVFRLAPHIAAIDENERIFGAGSAVVFASDPDVRVGDPFSQFGDGRLQPDVPAFVANLDDVGQR